MWPVVPLSKGQLHDVRKSDILNRGLYRKCNTYRGGGGYDRFPEICQKRLGFIASEQFVVQLQKCVLDCPYCYVTRAGVWGQPKIVSTEKIVLDFINSGQQVFHLMGGAPAIYIDRWPELISELFRRAPRAVFHSDLMLVEGRYSRKTLSAIKHARALYAIDIKGLTDDEWTRNTRMPPKWKLFWENWRRVQDAGINAYPTFTAVSEKDLNHFWVVAENEGIDTVKWKQDSFVIDLIDYKAIPYVDEVKWGSNQ